MFEPYVVRWQNGDECGAMVVDDANGRIHRCRTLEEAERLRHRLQRIRRLQRPASVNNVVEHEKNLREVETDARDGK